VWRRVGQTKTMAGIAKVS